MNTEKLIEKLSQEKSTNTVLRSPVFYGLCLVATLLLYGMGSFLFFDIRPDIAVQFGRAFFAIEIAFLVFLVLSSIVAAIFSMYPDVYQKYIILTAPYVIFTLLVAFVIFQIIAMPMDAHMVIPLDEHGMQCAVCIAAVSLLPSVLIFGLVRKGASVTPLSAGSFSVLAAAGIGSLVLRLSEINDSLVHIVLWHYAPTLVFAVIGAVIGKWLLKW